MFSRVVSLLAFLVDLAVQLFTDSNYDAEKNRTTEESLNLSGVYAMRYP
jgi:hypothetical protein